MIRFFGILALFLSLGLNAFGQEPSDSIANSYKQLFNEADLVTLEKVEDTLGLLAYTIVNDSLPKMRFLSCKKLIPTLVEALKIPNSFHYPFKQLQSISIQYPPDSTFRIFTWQLYADKGEYHYYGAIQMNTKELELIPLIDRSQNIDGARFKSTKPDNWYGALYYNLTSFQNENDVTEYLLFGYERNSFFTKRKVIDVLSFDNGKATFGKPVFFRANENDSHPPVLHRVIIEYYAGANIRLNYDNIHHTILFDHLIDVQGSNGIQKVPDGSYEGYKYLNGKWIHEEKMFHLISDEPPGLDYKNQENSRKTDILGRKKN